MKSLIGIVRVKPLTGRFVFKDDIKFEVRGLLCFLFRKWAEDGAAQLDSFQLLLCILCICRIFITFFLWTTAVIVRFLVFFWPFLPSTLTVTYLPSSNPRSLHALPSHHVASGSAALPSCVICVLRQNVGDIRLIESHIFPPGADGDGNRAKWRVNIWSWGALCSKSHLMLHGNFADVQYFKHPTRSKRWACWCVIQANLQMWFRKEQNRTSQSITSLFSFMEMKWPYMVIRTWGASLHVPGTLAPPVELPLCKSAVIMY